MVDKLEGQSGFAALAFFVGFPGAYKERAQKKAYEFLHRLFVYGSLSWARTSDKRMNSPLLYQLSYQGIVIF